MNPNGNPYVVSNSPNYAAPMLDFSQFQKAATGQQQKPQQQQQQQQGQQNGPQQNSGQSNFAAMMRKFLQGQGGQQQGYAPPSYQQPGQPLQIDQGSVAGANTMMNGLH